jgi:hypothetical protein
MGKAYLERHSCEDPNHDTELKHVGLNLWFHNPTIAYGHDSQTLLRNEA